VVVFSQLRAILDKDVPFARRRISKLVKQGLLVPIKEGVFVISDLS
jgi:hypothetical protein